MCIPLKDLKRYLLDELKNALGSYGFVGKYGLLSKTEGSVKQFVQPVFADRRKENLTVLSVNLAVRHDNIEKIVVEFLSDLGKTDKLKISTVGASLAKLSPDTVSDWKLVDSVSCKHAALDIQKRLIATGFDFLDRSSDLEEILKFFAEKDWRKWYQSAGGRALRLPLVYYYLGRVEEAAKSFAEQYRFLEEQDDLLFQRYPEYVSMVERELGLAPILTK